MRPLPPRTPSFLIPQIQPNNGPTAHDGASLQLRGSDSPSSGGERSDREIRSRDLFLKCATYVFGTGATAEMVNSLSIWLQHHGIEMLRWCRNSKLFTERLISLPVGSARQGTLRVRERQAFLAFLSLGHARPQFKPAPPKLATAAVVAVPCMRIIAVEEDLR